MRADALAELFDYDPETGTIIWKRRDTAKLYHGESWNIRFAGKRAGTLRKGYWMIHIPGFGNTSAARIAYALYHRIDLDKLPEVIDHHDRNTQNDSISNLRAADQSKNNHNQGLKRNNKTGIKGITISPKSKKKPFRAHIAARGIQIEKSFSTLAEAIKWREEKVEEMHGEFGLSIGKEVDCVAR